MISSLFAAAFLLQAPKAPPQSTGPKLRAAVSGFEVKIPAISVTAQLPSGVIGEADIDIEKPAEFGTGMADQLVTALIESKKFIVLERPDLEDVLKELELQSKESIQEDSIVQAGKLLGAQVLLRGSITEMSYRRWQAGAGGVVGPLADDIISLGSGEFAAYVTMDLKIVDVQTGQILDSVMGRGVVRNKTQYLSLDRADIGFGIASFESSPLAKAVRAAIKDGVKKITGRLETVVWEARVIDVDETDKTLVYLNFGADAGLKPGAILAVKRPGKVLIDPQTKVVLGSAPGTDVGKLKLLTCEKKFSTAVIIEGNDFKNNDVVTYISGG